MPLIILSMLSKNEVKALCFSISKTPDSQTAFMPTKLNAKTILPFFSNMLKTQPISIAVIENESSVRKRPARKMAITDKMVKNSRLSVNLSAILDKSVEHHCIQKSRTKSVANRPPSFSFSFNSNKKRDFFHSLFFIFFDNQSISILQNRYYRLFL